MPFQGRELAFRLGLTGDAFKQFVTMFLGMSRMFHEQDLSLLEINPLVITGDNRLLCLDAKINIDSNALFRHKDLAELDDPSQQDPREARAQAVNLNYVALDGNIGCMVNGAGLAMGTMDIIKFCCSDAVFFQNFQDRGIGTVTERVSDFIHADLFSFKKKASGNA